MAKLVAKIVLTLSSANFAFRSLAAGWANVVHRTAARLNSKKYDVMLLFWIISTMQNKNGGILQRGTHFTQDREKKMFY